MDFATNTNKDIDLQSTDQYSTEEIEQKINAQSKQFSFQGLLPKIQKKLTALPLDHEGICTTVFPGQKLSPKGDAYRNGSAITNQNQNRIFLVFVISLFSKFFFAISPAFVVAIFSYLLG